MSTQPQWPEDAKYVLVYIAELRQQTRFAQLASVALYAALARQIADGTPEIFRSLHSLLTHTSNISKLLWPALPQRKKDELEEAYETRCSNIPKLQRAKVLRAALRLPSDSHPLKSRTLRDNLEHFDEKLDKWMRERDPRALGFVQDNVGVRGAIQINDMDDSDFWRWYDPATHTMWFRGESYNIKSLVTAVEELRQQVEEVLKR